MLIMFMSGTCVIVFWRENLLADDSTEVRDHTKTFLKCWRERNNGKQILYKKVNYVHYLIFYERHANKARSNRSCNISVE